MYTEITETNKEVYFMKTFSSKKKRFIFIGALILLVLALTAVLIITNRGIQDGFKFNIRYGVDLEEWSPVACAYKTQKRVFDIDNVTFDVYYGLCYPYDYEDDFMFAEVNCEKENGEEICLKYITETVYSNKYKINEKNAIRFFTIP